MEYPPILGPLLALLKSRKFLISIATLAADLIIASVPELEPVREPLIQVVTAVGGILVASIAFEDAAKNS